jgi:hypothetical protein
MVASSCDHARESYQGDRGMTRELKPTDEAEVLARVADFQAMAQKLLDDPEAAAAFRRVGVTGDFTPEEHDAIYKRLGLGDYNPCDNSYIALDYQAIIQALARRVAAGVYRTVFDKDAYDWVCSNTFVGAYHLTTGMGNPIRERPLALDDIVLVVREFMAWDELPLVIQAMRAAETPKPGKDSEDLFDDLKDAARPLGMKRNKLFRKYGLVRHDRASVVDGLVNWMIGNGKAADDVDAVREYLDLRKYS